MSKTCARNRRVTNPPFPRTSGLAVGYGLYGATFLKSLTPQIYRCHRALTVGAGSPVFRSLRPFATRIRPFGRCKSLARPRNGNEPTALRDLQPWPQMVEHQKVVRRRRAQRPMRFQRSWNMVSPNQVKRHRSCKTSCAFTPTHKIYQLISNLVEVNGYAAGSPRRA
jgi:hypothetical protein